MYKKQGRPEGPRMPDPPIDERKACNRRTSRVQGDSPYIGARGTGGPRGTRPRRGFSAFQRLGIYCKPTQHCSIGHWSYIGLSTRRTCSMTGDGGHDIDGDRHWSYIGAALRVGCIGARCLGGPVGTPIAGRFSIYWGSLYWGPRGGNG